ncbi:transposase [bacterium BMS3Abin04]|nr:transposase [bacterium BMS3Abin04]
MHKRKHYTAEQKAKILRELLDNNLSVSQLCEQYNVRPNDIYNWKKKLFESAPTIFGA